jgi:very-short-patch-repair endonuclease
MASHRSAARLWGVERPDSDPIDVLVAGRGGAGPRLDGVLVHHPRDHSDLTPSTRAGIRVTNPLRMLCDLAAVDAEGITPAIEHVIIAGYARPSALRSLVDRHARRGRTGVDALRRAVLEWPLGGKPADSVLEPAMARLLAEHGLPPAHFHAVIEGFEVDFLIVDTPVVIECDGWEFHASSRAQWARDTERDAVLSAAGYVTIRRTWEHIRHEPGRTAQRIEAVLRQWAPEVLIAARAAVSCGRRSRR